jgi:hypothetical protein
MCGEREMFGYCIDNVRRYFPYGGTRVNVKTQQSYTLALCIFDT